MKRNTIGKKKHLKEDKMNKILHGDCLELMKDIPNGSIDMILCDLQKMKKYIFCKDIICIFA